MIENNAVHGILKFNKNITIKQIEKIGESMLSKDKNYSQLFVVQTSNTTNGIGFRYDLKSKKNRKSEHDAFLKNLLKSLGNDLVGYEISCPVWTIK